MNINVYLNFISLTFSPFWCEVFMLTISCSVFFIVVMYLYAVSNSTAAYCSSAPRLSRSCSDCLASTAGCGWCLAAAACRTRSAGLPVWAEYKWLLPVTDWRRTDCEGDWVGPGDFCLHDSLYSCIILITILLIVLLLILLIFFILYSCLMCSSLCIKFINNKKPLRPKLDMEMSNSEMLENDPDVGRCWWDGDDSYVYGRNLSLGKR